MLPQINPKSKYDSFMTVILHFKPVNTSWVHATTENDRNDFNKMMTSWRVVSFFFIVFVLPTLLISIPLYARYHLYPTLHFWATDGDMLSLHDTVSSFWCQGQKVSVNGSFEAFQIQEAVVNKSKAKRIMPLEATLFLLHDDAEEWGFYLIKGSKFIFSACARWPGGSVVVVKGKENLRRCFYRENDLSEELRERYLVNRLLQMEKLVPVNNESTLTEYDENHGGEILDESDLLANSDIADSIATNKAKHAADVEKLPDLKSVKSELRSIKKITNISHKPFIHHQSSKSLGIFTINETLDVFADNSSISSSEEYLSQCTSTIASIELTPFIDCRDKVNLSLNSDVRWKFNVNESDFYYFIFASDNNIEANVINFNLYLQKSVYKVREATSRCVDSKECFFPFPFLSSTGVILDVKGKYNSITKLKDLNNYRVVSVCQPRFIVYTVLIILVPFIIVLFAFR